MRTQTPSRVPISYFVFWVAIFVAFTKDLKQAFAAIAIAAIVAFFTYGGMARVRNLVGKQIRP